MYVYEHAHPWSPCPCPPLTRSPGCALVHPVCAQTLSFKAPPPRVQGAPLHTCGSCHGRMNAACKAVWGFGRQVGGSPTSGLCSSGPVPTCFRAGPSSLAHACGSGRGRGPLPLRDDSDPRQASRTTAAAPPWWDGGQGDPSVAGILFCWCQPFACSSQGQWVGGGFGFFQMMY